MMNLILSSEPNGRLMMPSMSLPENLSLIALNSNLKSRPLSKVLMNSSAAYSASAFASSFTVRQLTSFCTILL